MVQLVFVIPCMLFYYDLLQSPHPPVMRERGDLGSSGHCSDSSISPLRHDAVVEDDFALSVPDDVREVGVAGDDLCSNAA